MEQMSQEQTYRDGFVPRYNIRTDLALEAHEFIKSKTAAEIPGVASETVQEDGIAISRITVQNEAAAQQLGKKPGNYITLEAPKMRTRDTELHDRLSEVLARELLNLAPLPQNLEETVLVVGLGNWNVTPDALGPQVIKELLVTRHMFQMRNRALGEGYRSVCAISPGVLGLTGIETSEIIQSLV
ncbi:MAG: GPR endopeptidase, partial [Firmicutes bacterium]|nr:GPR endopeptidase [Bacillota bacterium]